MERPHPDLVTHDEPPAFARELASCPFSVSEDKAENQAMRCEASTVILRDHESSCNRRYRWDLFGWPSKEAHALPYGLRLRNLASGVCEQALPFFQLLSDLLFAELDAQNTTRQSWSSFGW